MLVLKASLQHPYTTRLIVSPPEPGKVPGALLTFLGRRRLLPPLAVLLARDLGEGDEAEEQAGSPQHHAAAVRSREELE